MDEQKKELMEQQGAENENSDAQHNAPTRSYVIRILAGLYLLYTGFQLCKGVLNGEEGAGWGFMAAGIAFLVIAVILLIGSGKYFFQKGKAEKMPEHTEEQVKKSPEEDETESKTMSISQRANLAKHLQEEEKEINE